MIEVWGAKVEKKKSGISRIKDCGVIKFYTYLLKKEASQKLGQLMRSLQKYMLNSILSLFWQL
jgi:hypothetical protein